MTDSKINVVPVTCRLSNLTVFKTDPNQPLPDTVLHSNQPFSLVVTVEFLGPGAIALLSLCPSIQVEFYAKPLGPESGTTLGKASVKANPDTFSYPVTVTLPPPASLNLRPKTLYCIGVTLQVGAPEWPSLINGFTEDLTIEIYTPPGKKG